MNFFFVLVKILPTEGKVLLAYGISNARSVIDGDPKTIRLRGFLSLNNFMQIVAKRKTIFTKRYLQWVGKIIQNVNRKFYSILNKRKKTKTTN